MQDHLIIDGRNNLYRLVFACLSVGNEEFVESVMRSTVSYISRFNPKHVHVAWDYAGDNWRKAIYAPYKDRASQRLQWNEKYGCDVVDVVNVATPIIEEGFNHLGIRQYTYKYQEADDLMYSLCSVLHKQSKGIVVVSSDGDLVQLSQQFNNVKVFNQLKDSFEKEPENNVIRIKCLKGDKSDNISGFKGIGPKKAAILSEDKEKLDKFLDAGDGSRREYYNLYEKLIDLSKNPFLDHNNNYVAKLINKEVNTYKSSEFQRYLRKHKLSKLLMELRKFKKICSGLC